MAALDHSGSKKRIDHRKLISVPYSIRNLIEIKLYCNSWSAEGQVARGFGRPANQARRWRHKHFAQTTHCLRILPHEHELPEPTKESTPARNYQNWFIAVFKQNRYPEMLLPRLAEKNRTILPGQCLQPGCLTLEVPVAASVAVHPRCMVARNLTQLNWHLVTAFVQETSQV